jgi:hypothetical protein
VEFGACKDEIPQAEAYATGAAWFHVGNGMIHVAEVACLKE